jgi:hypothetical protein
MNIIRCTLPVLMLLVNSPSSATATTKELLEAISSESDKKSVSEIYLAGIFEGFSWSNVLVKNRGEKPFYCQPEKLALKFEQQIDILKKYVVQDPRMVDAPVGLSIFYAMRYTFPCPTQ